VPARVEFIAVTSAADMLAASLQAAQGCDVFIGAAAVADYRPAQIAAHKLKKTAATASLQLELVQNPDIVASIAALAQKPFTVGFAAESENLIAYAQQKLVRKNLDLIIANNIVAAGIGFNADDNAVTVIDRAQQQALTQRSKTQLARDLIAIIAHKIMTQA
jgi:phosphopantothenoylcysteine decarboxylase / phosphopantothenate---cysteine ligase